MYNIYILNVQIYTTGGICTVGVVHLQNETDHPINQQISFKQFVQNYFMVHRHIEPFI